MIGYAPCRATAPGIAALLLLACTQSDRSGPTLEEVVPSSGPRGIATEVRILGAGFQPLVHSNFDDEEQSRVALAFTARLGSNSLNDVRFVSATELLATVPASLASGTYPLTVANPGGGEGTLEDAFTVLGAGDGRLDGGPPSDGRPDAPTPPTDSRPDLPLDGRPDGQPDTQPGPDTVPWPDAPWPDVTPWPDTTPWPDLIPWPDGPPQYVFEDFTTGTGAVQPKTGNWSVHTGQKTLRQTSVGENGNYALAPVPVSNYVAETKLEIHSIDGLPSIVEGAALAVRVQPQSNPSFPPGQYGCFVSPDQQSFGIYECNGNQTYCTLHQSTSISFSYNTPYTVRATVSGNNITCQLLEQSRTVNITDNTYSSGDVALATFHASASFHYLSVYGL